MSNQKMVEDWIAARKSRFWIEDRLETHGMPADEAAKLIDQAEEAFQVKKRRRLRIFRVVGIIMLVFGVATSVWGLFFVEGQVVVSTASFAIAIVGLIVTIEPGTLEHFNAMFGR